MAKVRRQGEWIYVKVGDTEMRGRPDPGGLQIEQVSPTYTKEEVQEAVDTIQGMLTSPTVREGMMADKCSASLLELRNAIKRELDDEGAAGHKYADMSAKFTHLKEPQKADMLRLISQDELIHQAVLHGIVDIITEECGE